MDSFTYDYTAGIYQLWYARQNISIHLSSLSERLTVNCNENKLLINISALGHHQDRWYKKIKKGIKNLITKKERTDPGDGPRPKS